MLPLTWCACYFPKIIILRFKVISEKIRKNPVNTEKTFSMYYNGKQNNCPTVLEHRVCVKSVV
jgi:hypothetical protein